jgi:predicted nucleic acid-binding protein
VIVDTSVWIDFFRGSESWQVEVLAQRLERDEPIALTDVIFTEILQGLATERAVQRVERRLLAHDIYVLEPLDDHRRAASLYRTCRRRGVTIRRTLDCLIAAVCIRERRSLLHADADFDRLAAHTELQVVGSPTSRARSASPCAASRASALLSTAPRRLWRLGHIPSI